MKYREILPGNEGVQYHLTNNIPLHESIFRMGSDEYFKMYRESRKLYNEGKLKNLHWFDEEILRDTLLGEWEQTRWGDVPLDMIIDEERLVLPSSIKLDQSWSNDSKTFLILRRYPYYDYKATTNFQIDYKIMSLNETVKTPSGIFEDCIMIKGEGQTNFIGDSEIGSIGIKITSMEWYSKKVGLVKMVREEKTDTDLFGTTKMIQILENYNKR